MGLFDQSEQIEQYHLLPPSIGCDESGSGWQVFSDDDGTPMSLLANFAFESDARMFCAARSLSGIVAEYLEAIHNLSPAWLVNEELVNQAEAAWALVEAANTAERNSDHDGDAQRYR